MASKQGNKKTLPLIVEDHPEDYEGYPFITLIQYHDQHVLAIIDNADNKTIKAFVLDLCSPAGIDEQQVVQIASEWYNKNSDKFPVSIEFSRRGLTHLISPIQRRFNIDYVTRVIGPLPSFDMSTTAKVRRRKRKPVPPGMQIHYKDQQTD